MDSLEKIIHTDGGFAGGFNANRGIVRGSFGTLLSVLDSMIFNSTISTPHHGTAWIQGIDRSTFIRCEFGSRDLFLMSGEWSYEVNCCNFFDCVFTDEASISKCTFNQCRLLECDLVESLLVWVVFVECDLTGTLFPRVPRPLLFVDCKFDERQEAQLMRLPKIRGVKPERELHTLRARPWTQPDVTTQEMAAALPRVWYDVLPKALPVTR